MYPPYRLKKKFKSYQDRLSLDGICENINSIWYIKDKLDLLAMCLIEYASRSESVNNKNVVEDDGLTEKLHEID